MPKVVFKAKGKQISFTAATKIKIKPPKAAKTPKIKTPKLPVSLKPASTILCGPGIKVEVKIAKKIRPGWFREKFTKKTGLVKLRRVAPDTPCKTPCKIAVPKTPKAPAKPRVTKISPRLQKKTYAAIDLADIISKTPGNMKAGTSLVAEVVGKAGALIDASHGHGDATKAAKALKSSIAKVEKVAKPKIPRGKIVVPKHVPLAEKAAEAGAGIKRVVTYAPEGKPAGKRKVKQPRRGDPKVMGAGLQKHHINRKYGEYGDRLFDSTLGFDENMASIEQGIRDLALGQY